MTNTYTSSHQLKHQFLSRNINYKGYLLINYTTLVNNQVVYYVGYLPFGDEAVLIRKGVGEADLSEGVDAVGGVFEVDEVVLGEEGGF